MIDAIVDRRPDRPHRAVVDPSADAPLSTDEARQRRWRAITLSTLIVGYVGFYICRSNLSVVSPLLQADPDIGLTESEYGRLASLGTALYAVGKLTNGITTDYIGGRVIFLSALVGTIVCTLWFGLAGAVGSMFVAWAFNRYVQSAGWGAAVKLSGRWFPAHSHATVMGYLSLSYLFGDWFARRYLGEAILRGFGWRDVFLLSAATTGVITVLALLLLKSSPRRLGMEEPAADPRNVYGDDAGDTRPPSPWTFLKPLVTNPAFLLVCALNFCLTLLRQTFNDWNPQIFTDVVGVSAGDAAIASSWFPLVGGVAALVSGHLSDRFDGRRGIVLLPSLVLMIAALAALWVVPIEGRPWTAVVLTCLVAFFLLGPYSFLSGVLALDFGGKRGASSAAGLSDSFGYLGGILAGAAVGDIVVAYGWSAAFGTLLVVGGVSAVLAAVYLFRFERALHAEEP